jgi:2',3'-cyclic-nucleotide 2'-phosphodiesterase (5'-nucleotidase family)
VKVLREQEGVDLVVMLSELGLANNIRLAEANPGIDFIFSSDMHEETREPVVTSTGTWVVEEGQDGTALGRLKVHFKNGKITRRQFKQFRISDDIPEDPTIAALVAEQRRSFVSGPDFVQHVNPFNGSKLQRPIDTVAGYTAVPLHRSNFSHEEMPAVIEGSSHDFLADAFMTVANADIGAIRGFRYGTHVPVGPITMEDLYHFVAIGPQIAIGTIKGQALKNQIENAANGSLDPNVANWTGGWLFNFGGVTMDFNPYGANGARASNIKVNGQPLVVSNNYTYASYWYAADPTLINVVPATNISVLKNEDGSPMDGTEVVYRYLQALPFRTANPELNRITLTAPLPAPKFGFPEVQPLRGATP